MSPTVRAAHALRLQDRKLAADVLAEHDMLLMRVAELERKLAAAQRAILYPMSDLA